MPSLLPDAVPIAELRRVLVTKLRHHGDVLLTSPVFTTLARAAPGTEVDALVYAETAPMLAYHPHISQLHTIDREAKRAGTGALLSQERALIKALRARRYDLIVHLTEHPRGLWLAVVLNPRYAVTRERPHKRLRRLWRRYYTHFFKEPAATQRHVVDINLDALRRIGIYPTLDEKRLVLVPGREAEARADALIAEHALTRGQFVQAHPGSRWLFKCWPASRMAALFDRIAAAGHTIVITGAPDPEERALVSTTLAATRPQTRASIRDVAGKLSLSELAALTARARIFVGVDSAPMHIAAAVGTPTVALFGPSGEASWGPWMVPHRVVASDEYSCRPCGLDGCGGGKVSECLTTLPVDRVWSAFASLMAETKPLNLQNA